MKEEEDDDRFGDEPRRRLSSSPSLSPFCRVVADAGRKCMCDGMYVAVAVEKGK